MLAAIHEDLPVAVDVSFEQEKDVCGRLDDSPGIGRDTRHACGQAVRFGIIPGLSFFHDLFGCGQNWDLFSRGQTLSEVADRTSAIPDAGQIRLPIGEPRHWPGWRSPSGPSAGCGILNGATLLSREYCRGKDNHCHTGGNHVKKT